ncbi:MAG: sigma-70 family RNA polymerase sigma factor [Acidobacteria bacterium]|nr:sigma-70 family RNA polymerase sigma factor [Acidobacteriota bacterium]
MTTADPHATIDAIWRTEAPKIIGGLTRLVRDLATAEDLAHDALVAALEQWPSEGVPAKPGAWLMATAKHRAIDRIRRSATFARKLEALGAEIATGAWTPRPDDVFDDMVQDDVLRLVFMACHPMLAADARVALTLRFVGGLTTAEIARAYLVPEATMAQRLVRAKKRLARERPPFELPAAPERQARMASVLDVIYLVFNEGYAATSGGHVVRRGLCDEARRLARLLVEVAPAEAEAHGLAALLDLQASRLDARVDADGAPVLLPAQDRTRWDAALIRAGLASLDAARHLTDRPGVYTLQAAIAACHARAATPADTDWAAIVIHYAALFALDPSPVVALNGAVAVGMAEGPAAALPIVDALAADPALRGYHYVPAVRADLLRRLGCAAEAAAEFTRAAALTANERERAQLLAEAARLAPPRATDGSAATS